MNVMTTFTTSKRKPGILALGQLTVPVLDPIRKTFKITDLTRDIIVKIPKSSDIKNSDSIRLLINKVPTGSTLDLSGVNLGDPLLVEFDLPIKLADFPANGTDVTYEVDYEVYDTASEDGQASGLFITARFDQLSPGGQELPPISFTEAQLAGGITIGDIANGKLPVIIDPYHDGEPEDTIELWIGTGPAESTGGYLTTSFSVIDPTAPQAVAFELSDLETIQDGHRYFGYRVTDWAGNVSGLSAVTAVDVFLNLPTLAAPLVPENDDGLVTYTDATDGGVGVEIPHYDGAAVDDNLYVVWGGQTLPPYPINAAEAAADPITTILVPYKTVFDVGSAPDIPVTYWMKRVGVPRIDAGVTTVSVDLSTPGGPITDPDPTDPSIHPNITKPDVQCGLSPPNTITPTDYGKDATATIHRVGADLKPIWIVGDVIQLTWGTIAGPTLASVPVTAVNEGADIKITVPYSTVIDVTGVGSVSVYFTVTRTLVPGTSPITVTVQSPVQVVSVVSSAALPGDGAPLAEGVFPEANASNIITRAVGIDGTTFELTLSGVSNIDLGQKPTVSYNFVGVSSVDAVNPSAPPIEPSRVKADDVIITQSMLDAGKVEVPLPYALTYFICRNGAILDYSISNDLGRTNGIQRFVRFAMNQGGGACSLP